MTRVVVIVGFMISFAAGMMLSHAWPMKPGAGKPPGGGPGGRESWLAEQLSLTPDQQVKMKDIWQEAGRFGGRGDPGKRAAIRRSQDEAIAALIHPEDKVEYETIIREHREMTEALEAEGKKAFAGAIEKTKAILTPEQLKKYEAFLSKSGPDGRGRSNEGHDRAAGRPATQPVDTSGR